MNKKLLAVDLPIDHQRTTELTAKANYAFNLIESIADELGLAYNWSGSLQGVAKQRHKILMQIVDAQFKGK